MARRRQRETTIWFPWERGGGILRGRGMARAKLVALALGMATLLLLLGARERRKTGVRSTMATIGVVRGGLDAYRADHERKCPASLDALKAEGYIGIDPIDAWGRPLRLVCPGQKDPEGYDLTSDGPDGEIGGLDRVE
ncbi:type II secretion system protein GspG [Polyangium sp. y55x31]|uniref:type II secretion system protein GspG n=1 Tax=Polyangium sp. y55x31 TaxID=3042688 RepID=UPI0024824617|nr:type II secretion system protein GspG [Polyangium sp. y55x31]MDI1484810.1 type II secretion system protein GspG [Polyangium sp. y55x31]